jgi:hypothetical protein
VSLPAEVLDALLSAGATAEMIVAAVKADASLEEAKVEARRAKDRERQRRHRLSRDVTVTACDSADKPLSPLDPPKKDPEPQKIHPPLSPKPCVSERASRWHRLPEDWQPRTLPTPVQAKVDQWPPGSLEDELAAFRRWAANAENKNGKGRKLDWDQAWRNWIGRRHDERYSRLSGTVTSLRGTRPDPALDLLRTARAAEDRENNRGARLALPSFGPS